MEQKPLISYPQIFLKFLLYFMIDVMKKKSFFLITLFSLFFIFSRREQIKIKSQTLYFSNQKYWNYQQFNGRQMPPVFEVSTFKLILKHVFACNFLWDLHNKRFKLLIDKLCLWTNIQQEKYNYSLPYVSTVLM